MDHSFHKRLCERSFGLIFAGIFCAIAGIGWYVWHLRLVWALYVALVFLLLAVVCPGVLLPLNLLWSWFTIRLGRVNNTILLGLFFFLFIFPFGLLLRILRWDPMQRRIKSSINSFWHSVYRQANEENLRDLF